jgi:hypothetical protein
MLRSSPVSPRKAAFPRGTRTTVEIPDELLREAKHRAVEEPGGLRGVLIRALEGYLGQKKPPAGRRRRD